MFCPNCGSVIPDDSKFCPICGANMSDIAPSSAQEKPQPPVQSDSVAQQQQGPYNQYNGYQQQQQGYNGYDQGYNNYQQPAMQQQQPAAPPKEKKPVDWKTFYHNYFYTLYVLIGVGAFVCSQLEQVFVGNAFFFVLFTIFVFPLMLAFLALGIIRFVVGIKTRQKQENPTKEKSKDIMIFGLSIIIFVFLLLTTIITLSVRAEIF